MRYYHPFHHLGLKAVAVGLAALLWLTVSREPIVERSLRVPLQYQNIPAHLEMVGEPLSTVNVRLRGASGRVGRLESGAVLAVLDLSSARPGPRLFHLLAEQVQAPFGIEVVQVQPVTIPLDFERAQEKRVPVKPAVEGEPAAGYLMRGVTSDPADVLIIGPESRLKEVTHATTEPVSIQGKTESVTETVTIGVSDPDVRLKDARSARVRVAIEPQPVERRFTNVPVRLRNVTARLTATAVPAIVQLTLRGAAARIAEVSGDPADVYVDLEGLGPGRYTLAVKSEAKTGIEVHAIEPATVGVRIR